MSKSAFEDEIRKHGKLLYTNCGDSMMPLIKQGRDILVISAADRKLRKYDIPLYKRDSGQYVLHRIIGVRKNSYIMCGDNRWNREYGVEDRHIIGVLSAVIRNGKEIPLRGLRYSIYVHIWCDFFLLRALILRILYWLRGEN